MPFTGADIECILKDVDDPNAPANAKQQHVPVAVGLKVSSHIFPDMDMDITYHHGTDCIEWLFDELDAIYAQAKPYLEHIVPMERLTKEQRRAYYRRTQCYLCKKPMNGRKNIDHCHFTGEKHYIEL